ncbi:30S ribosomal protein S6 [Candidatus Peregrinibacteria bacterium]|nr:30S ribosomal protein S6 [Candidatus Peregrinibacteria bacterium]
MENTDVLVRKYELMLIFSPEVTEEIRNKEFAEIQKFVSGANGEITFEDVFGMRNFAYSIKHKKQGFYVILDFTIPTDRLEELQKSLNINAAVLRYLLVVLPENYEPRTLASYDEDGEKMRKELEQQRKEKKEARAVPKRKPAPAPVKKAVKARKPVVEKVEEVKETKKTKDTQLEDLDKKLKSIIDDPDISL